MSRSYNKSLAVDFNASRRMVAILCIAHAGCVLCLVSAGVSAMAVVPVTAVVAGSLYATLKRYALLRSPRSPVRLVLGDMGHSAVFSDGRAVPVELLPGGVNTRHWIILHLAVKTGERLSVPVAADMLPPETYRRLRVWLTVNSG